MLTHCLDPFLTAHEPKLRHSARFATSTLQSVSSDKNHHGNRHWLFNDHFFQNRWIQAHQCSWSNVVVAVLTLKQFVSNNHLKSVLKILGTTRVIKLWTFCFASNQSPPNGWLMWNKWTMNSARQLSGSAQHRFAFATCSMIFFFGLLWDKRLFHMLFLCSISSEQMPIFCFKSISRWPPLSCKLMSRCIKTIRQLKVSVHQTQAQGHKGVEDHFGVWVCLVNMHAFCLWNNDEWRTNITDNERWQNNAFQKLSWQVQILKICTFETEFCRLAMWQSFKVFSNSVTWSGDVKEKWIRKSSHPRWEHLTKTSLEVTLFSLDGWALHGPVLRCFSLLLAFT